MPSPGLADLWQAGAGMAEGPKLSCAAPVLQEEFLWVAAGCDGEAEIPAFILETSKLFSSFPPSLLNLRRLYFKQRAEAVSYFLEVFHSGFLSFPKRKLLTVSAAWGTQRC